MLKGLKRWLGKPLISAVIPLPDEGMLHLVKYYSAEIRRDGAKFSVPVVAIYNVEQLAHSLAQHLQGYSRQCAECSKDGSYARDDSKHLPSPS